MRAPIDLNKKFCIPPRPPIDLKTQVEFNMKDGDGNGVLTSDEYGVGKETQDEFRRYDRNSDGKVSKDEFASGRRWDNIRDHVSIGGIKPPIKFPPKQLEPKLVEGGAEKKEEPSFFQKALPWLALGNPITAPLGLFSLAKKFFSKD